MGPLRRFWGSKTEEAPAPAAPSPASPQAMSPEMLQLLEQLRQSGRFSPPQQAAPPTPPQVSPGTNWGEVAQGAAMGLKEALSFASAMVKASKGGGGGGGEAPDAGRAGFTAGGGGSITFGPGGGGGGEDWTSQGGA